MREKITYIVGGLVILVIVVLVIGSLYVGRYQLVSDESGQYVYKVDTLRGKTWRAGSSGVWRPMKTEEVVSKI